MEQAPTSPPHVRKVWPALAVVVALLLLLWFATIRTHPSPAIRVGFATATSGHMGDFYSPHFLVGFFTNATHRQILMENPIVQRDKNGRIINDLAGHWGGTNGFCSVGPSEVMPFPFEVPTTLIKYKITFDYSSQAGLIQRMVSPILGRLFGRNVTQPRLVRLFEQGWLDGRLHMKYEGQWETNR